MQRIAAEVGYSETAFAAPIEGGWRVRYFSPESEVPFCGHATIALGAALAQAHGDGVFALKLNEADITVEGRSDGKTMAAALQSPPTRSAAADPQLVLEALSLLGYGGADLDPRIPPALAHGGADHLVLALGTRALLAAMAYDLDEGRALMNRAGLVTIHLAYAETPSLFHTRNPFASGGVYRGPGDRGRDGCFRRLPPRPPLASRGCHRPCAGRGHGQCAPGFGPRFRPPLAVPSGFPERRACSSPPPAPGSRAAPGRPWPRPSGRGRRPGCWPWGWPGPAAGTLGSPRRW